MKTIVKTVASGLLGLVVLGAGAAYAGDDSDRRDNDRRGYKSEYYDDRDERHRKSDRRRDGRVSLTVRVGDDGYYSDRRYRDGRYRDGDRRARRGRVVHREVYRTRYRARIVLIEEVRRGRNGYKRLVCTVRARGPEADYVSVRRMHRIANRDCSRRARIRVLA